MIVSMMLKSKRKVSQIRSMLQVWVDSGERSGGGLLLRCSSTKKKLLSSYTYEFVVQLVVEENRLTKFVVRFVIKPQTNETWLAI